MKYYNAEPKSRQVAFLILCKCLFIFLIDVGFNPQLFRCLLPDFNATKPVTKRTLVLHTVSNITYPSRCRGVVNLCMQPGLMIPVVATCPSPNCCISLRLLFELTKLWTKLE